MSPSRSPSRPGPRLTSSAVAVATPPLLCQLAVLSFAALLSFPSLASAQGYSVVYPSDCDNVCSYASPYDPSSGYYNCITVCQNCLLYNYHYAYFIPYFYSTSAGYYYSNTYYCGWYLPWWAWLLISVAIFACVCLCLPLCIAYFCFRGVFKFFAKKKAADETKGVVEEGVYVPGYAPGPDASTVPQPGAYPVPAPPPAHYPPPQMPQY